MLARLSEALEDLRDYASEYVRALGQSFLALSFDLGGLVAGYLISAHLRILFAAPWAVALYPIVLSKRGALTGIYCGRLSTGLHVGTVKPSFTDNTHEFWMLRGSLITLTFLSGALIGSIVAAISVVAWGMPTGKAANVVLVALGVSALSLLVTMFFSEAAAFVSYKLGLDPDVILYPVMSTVADILVTLVFIGVLSAYFYSPLGYPAIAAAVAVFAALTVYAGYRGRDSRVYMRTIKESAVALVLVSIITNTTGYLLKGISDIVRSHAEVYMAYPALIDTVGDVASIVGCTTTTRIALGGSGSLLQLFRAAGYEASSGWIASIVMFLLYAAISCYSLGQPGKWASVARLLLFTNVIVVPLMVSIALAIAATAHKRGWDPDHFVNPLETTLADSLSTLTLYAAIIIFGVQ